MKKGPVPRMSLKRVPKPISAREHYTLISCFGALWLGVPVSFLARKHVVKDWHEKGFTCSDRLFKRKGQNTKLTNTFGFVLVCIFEHLLGQFNN